MSRAKWLPVFSIALLNRKIVFPVANLTDFRFMLRQAFQVVCLEADNTKNIGYPVTCPVSQGKVDSLVWGCCLVNYKLGSLIALDSPCGTYIYSLSPLRRSLLFPLFCISVNKHFGYFVFTVFLLFMFFHFEFPHPDIIEFI